MINAVARYFKNEINNLQRSTDVDVMSSNHYHIIYIYQDQVVENLVRGYAKIFAIQNKKYGVDSKMSGEWLGQYIKEIREAATQCYNKNYTSETSLKKYYPKQGADFKFFPKGFDIKLIIPPGAFRARKDMSESNTGRGNVPYINQMFAGVYANALVEMGNILSGMPLATTFSQSDVRKNKVNPRNLTHGRVRGSGKENNLKTTATYGAARNFAGMNESGEFVEGKDIDTRIRRDSNVKNHSKIVGDKTAVHIIDLFKNAINTEFNLTDIKNTTLNELNRNIEIELEYADSVHNKQMEGKDKSGMKRYVAEYEKKLLKKRNLDRLARQFKVSAVEMQGSKSMKEKSVAIVPHLIIKNMFPHRSNPDMRLRVNKKMVALATKEIGKNTKSKKTKLTKTQSKGKKQIGRAGIVGAAIKRGRTQSHVEQKAGTNPMALQNLLNEILPATVAQNMTSPALNYRTGRFANSVRVDGITQGPRGGNTMIEATYMTNPYETFAPGGQKYTPQRDPERLIKRSIRQVASGIVGARFGINIQ